MTKSIKDTFIENMIMNQHGEKIKQVQELLIKGIEDTKRLVEKNVLWEITHGDNHEAIETYKKQLNETDNLLEDVRFNFLNLSLNKINTEIFRHDVNGTKEYNELVEALKQNDKPKTSVHSVPKSHLAKLHTKEKVLNSHEVKALLDTVNIVVNFTNPDNSNKMNASELVEKLREALEKDIASWY